MFINYPNGISKPLKLSFFCTPITPIVSVISLHFFLFFAFVFCFYSFIIFLSNCMAWRSKCDHICETVCISLLFFSQSHHTTLSDSDYTVRICDLITGIIIINRQLDRSSGPSVCGLNPFTVCQLTVVCLRSYIAVVVADADRVRVFDWI